MNDSSEESDDEIEVVVGALMNRELRNKIKDFVENTVSHYSEREFLKHFRINRELFQYLCRRFKETSEYKSLTKRAKSAEHELLLFLWYAGHEACSFEDIGIDLIHLSLL